VSAGTDSWLAAGSGMSGVHWTYTIRQRDAAVQLIMEGPDAESNARVFEGLRAHREQIEAEFGEALEWDRVDGRKRCFIGVTLPGGGYRDEDRWAEIQSAMIDTMLRLESAVGPRLHAVRR
jgi:hypothetical protein